MATAKAGVLTAVDVNGPMDVGQGSNLSDLFDLSSGGTWAAMFFVVAVVLLFVL